ncbi:MAG: hypothetical protein LBB78_00505 [Spirochaetaceae bacterium]|jgi:hypothetical protein|nr:hypothetical protein [Spirochaetaceae bacterium]
MKRSFLFGFLLFLVSTSLIFAQERKRGFYVDIGLGFGGISYFGGNTKTIADSFNKTANIHMTLDLSLLTIGWALTQNVYLVGTIAGVGDGYFDSQMNQSQLSIAMYGIGAKYYPLPSKKYLQLGLDLGVSTLGILQNNKTSTSDPGFSTRFSAAYDFDSTMTGFTGMPGGALMMNIIGNDVSLSYTLFFKLAFK